MKDVSSFANSIFAHDFFRLDWLKDWNNIPRLLFHPYKIINKKCIHHPKTDAMTFPADGTNIVFFGTEQPASVHCFDCFLDSGV
jgi:hypothetical protein